MTTTAIIDAAGVVQNLILAHHSEVDPQALGHPEGWQAINGAGGSIGDAWDGSQFVRPLPTRSLAELQADLTEAATAHRWEVETGGITLPKGVQIKTGTDDQARITSVIANAHLAGVESVDFKAANGWITLTLAEIEAIAGAIALHVQACFAAERAHHEAIEALPTIEDAQQYDITEGWPA